jgi:hypothetical protein
MFPQFETSLICDGCGAEIMWSPVVEHDRIYCCDDCACDRPCDCGDRMELEDGRKGKTIGAEALPA